jgi:hypothetical protein
VARRVPVVGWVADTTSAFLNLFLRSKLRSRGNTSCPLLGFGHVLPLADGTVVPYPGQLSIGSIDKSLLTVTEKGKGDAFICKTE